MYLLNKKTLLIAGALFSLALSPTQAQENELPIYKDVTYSFEDRTVDLVSRMTVEEKISQMVNSATEIARLDVPRYNWWNECLHGLGRAGRATIFPQAIGLGAAFDDDMMYRIADAISDEARAFYNAAFERGNQGHLYTGLTFYSPNVNIFRDPRWGRGQETYGEDPFLTSRIGVAFVKGLQGDHEKYLKTAACAKHYAVHSGPEKFRHEFNAECSTRDLYETYLPAFKALVQEANVESVMGAYNRTNGEACCASETLLMDILRYDWGFDGYVTSDCGALVDFYMYHKICETPEQAAALGIKNGLNLNCGSIYSKYLKKALDMDMITEAEIDELLVPLMLTRFKLGLFDPKEANPYNNVDENIVDSKVHKELAYEAALKSMVLLENKNNALPLSNDINQIYVTGPNANNADALLGNYFGVSSNTTTFLEGIVSRAPKGSSIQYKQGVLIDKENSNPIDWASGEMSDADVTVVCIGLTWLLEGEEGESIASTQMGDMYNYSMPQAQIEYLKTLRSKRRGTIVAVVSAGCPVDMTQIRENCDALIYAWYPGEAGGEALADILFGNANPSGRTPITFVKGVEQLPDFESYDMAGRTYRYMTEEPLYPFGYGLSYTTYKYSNIEAPAYITSTDSVSVSVTVQNVGSMAGEEVVQLYVSDSEASADVPVRQLAAFTRVELLPSQSKRVTLRVPADKFSLITDDNKRIVERGEFIVSVGGGQPVELTGDYEQCQISCKKTIEFKGL